MKLLISIDASLVLSGAVLTSFVGSSGLVGRMTLDRCLPQFLLKTNRRGTHHYIILSFLILCCSIMLLTGGDLLALGGVYTISFLGVMALFVVGNVLLKIRRSRLPRQYKASWGSIFIALLGTLSGIMGNILIKSEYVRYWAMYFVPTMSLIFVMLYRHHFLKLLAILAGDILKNFSFSKKVIQKLDTILQDLEGHGIIFFTKGDDAANLNRAMLYVQENEITDHVSVIHLYEKKEDIPKHLESDMRTIDKLYPEIQMELVLRQGKFTPDLITQLSKEFGIPKNYMFLGAPSAKFPYPISDLGGVRLII
ncbi:MAG: amino acid permease [Bdellovibrionota bacterium]